VGALRVERDATGWSRRRAPSRITGVDRARASAIAHRWHPVAAPVSDANLRRLLERLGPCDRVLDLGCGFGEWLLAALEAATRATGTGVDTSTPALDEARQRATARGLDPRVTWHEADAAGWQGQDFDAVLCIGASHAFGGLTGALTAVREHLRPGGRVLLGEGFWDGEPTPQAMSALGAEPGELPSLPGLVEAAQAAGFEPGYGHVSTAEEWDDYEWSWTGSLTEWALTEADETDRRSALAMAGTHREEWLAGYRGQLGFVTVVLHDAR
jgi:SAM-dependent methyltransferase